MLQREMDHFISLDSINLTKRTEFLKDLKIRRMMRKNRRRKRKRKLPLSRRLLLPLLQQK